jgi:hypothetical protein
VGLEGQLMGMAGAQQGPSYTQAILSKRLTSRQKEIKAWRLGPPR